MANQEIHEPTNYSQEIRKLQTTDPSHADVFNPLFERLINNDVFLKSLTERSIQEHTHSGVDGEGSQIPLANIKIPVGEGEIVTDKELAHHINERNPHGTRAVDVGAASKQEFDEHSADVTKHVQISPEKGVEDLPSTYNIGISMSHSTDSGWNVGHFSGNSSGTSLQYVIVTKRFKEHRTIQKVMIFYNIGNILLGTFERVSASDYVWGPWISISGIPPKLFYDEGNEMEFRTGGWVTGSSPGGGSQSKENNHLYLTAESPTSVSSRAYVTNNTIDLTHIKTIHVEWENVGIEDVSTQSHLVVSATKNGSTSTFDARHVRSKRFNKNIDVVDVSSLTGEYFIRVHAQDPSNSRAVRSELKVYRVWGES